MYYGMIWCTVMIKSGLVWYVVIYYGMVYYGLVHYSITVYLWHGIVYDGTVYLMVNEWHVWYIMVY